LRVKPIIIRDADGAPRETPWLSVVGVKPFISYLLEHSLIKHKLIGDLSREIPKDSEAYFTGT